MRPLLLPDGGFCLTRRARSGTEWNGEDRIEVHKMQELPEIYS